MPPSARKLLFRLVVLAAPVATCIGLSNFFFDPAHLFDPAIDEGIARLLGQGRNVSITSNYDERELQKLVIAGFSKAPDVIVIGSSRCLQLTHAIAPGRQFFNHSVSGASIEDFVALYDLYSRRNFIPRVVVFGLDPWLLNHNDLDTRWTSLAPEFASGAHRLGLDSLAHPSLLNEPWIDVGRELFSPTYFQSSLRSIPGLLMDGFNRRQYFPASAVPAETDIKCPDGSLIYGRRIRERNEAQVRAEALAYVGPEGAYRLKHFDSLDQRCVNLLAALVDQWQLRGVRPIFLLSPYHPVVFSQLNNRDEFREVMAAEGCFRSMAGQLKIPICGSFDPARLSVGPTEFYDGMHPHGDCLMKVLSPVLKRELDEPVSERF